jgi:phosphatidylserine/phosphatidylglycerophosphate/cardiolipin synthase-like enzyme
MISTAVLGAILVGAFWTVMLTLQGAERERNTLINAYHERALDLLAKNERERAAVIADISRERRDLLQQQIDRRDGDLARRITEITRELAERRSEFVSLREFAQFQILISQLRDQIRVIETTRPTTGELQQIGTAAKDQATKLEERVRSLENNLRPNRKPAEP